MTYIPGMTKAEAAKYLGVSVRTLSRYVTEGKLHPRYRKGKTNVVAVFEEAELKKLKKDLEHGGEGGRRRSVPIEAKFALLLEEAASLSGLPMNVLRRAIEQGSLKVVKKDGNVYIKRKDLEKFVDNL